MSVHKGEDAREARTRLARGLLEGVGATPDVAEAGAGDAADDPHFLDDVVASLVDDGVVALSRLPDRRASEEQIDRGLLGPAFSSALDRRRGMPAGARERARLGRLYALAGEVEKAASCYREVLDDRGPTPLSLVIELAHVASRAGERALALGAVDRVAEVVLTGETGQDKSPEDATVAGSALERTAELALTLGAAPARRGSRARRRPDLRARRARSASRQRTLGPARARRSSPRAIAPERARPSSGGARSPSAQGELSLAARALEVAGDSFLGTGDIEVAADWLEQSSDVRSAAGEKAAAARTALRAGDLRAGRGDLGAAAVAFERARAYASSARSLCSAPRSASPSREPGSPRVSWAPRSPRLSPPSSAARPRKRPRAPPRPGSLAPTPAWPRAIPKALELISPPRATASSGAPPLAPSSCGPSSWRSRGARRTPTRSSPTPLAPSPPTSSTRTPLAPPSVAPSCGSPPAT